MRVFRFANGSVAFEFTSSFSSDRAPPHAEPSVEQQLAASERAGLVEPVEVTFKDRKPA